MRLSDPEWGQTAQKNTDFIIKKSISEQFYRGRYGESDNTTFRVSTTLGLSKVYNYTRTVQSVQWAFKHSLEF